MAKIVSFTIREFFSSFWNIFLVMFLITSIIFIIVISNMTASVQITFLELGSLYLLTLPQILFISLSISFFLGAVSAYSQLSESQELIALLSAGVSPLGILKGVGLIGVAITIANLLFLFLSIPYAKNRFDNLKEIKKEEAKFNLQSKRISQQLGKWSLFLERKENDNFQGIYLYNRQSNQFVIGEEGRMISKGGYIRFFLNRGELYKMDKNFTLSFKEMVINHKIPQTSISIFDFKKYLDQNRNFFATYLPLALLPLALLLFIPAISFYHPRLHQNRHPLLEAIGLLVIYLLIAQQNKNLYIGLTIPLIFWVISIFTFRKRVYL